MGDIALKRELILLVVVALGGCSSSSNGGGATVAATPDDLRWMDTLRELDEKTDGALGAANFQSSRKELSAFADAAAHAHMKRSDEIEAWRASSFPTAPPNVSLPHCAQAGSLLGTKPADPAIVAALIAHRECALTYARDARANVRSSSARHVLEEAVQTFSNELQQFRAWRYAWK